MTLPTPTRRQGPAQVLLAVQRLLRDSALVQEYLDEQIAGLDEQDVTAPLVAPESDSVQIGDWSGWRNTGVAPPGLLIYHADDTTLVPDVAGETYQCESTIGIGVILAEQDTGGTTSGDVYLGSEAYATAIAYLLQTHLSDQQWGGMCGVYDCVIRTISAQLAPVEQTSGHLLRYSLTRVTVKWQTLQQPPLRP